MQVTGGKILEMRLEEIEGDELMKGKRLRLYFCEPARCLGVLLGLVFAPKDVNSGDWKSRQNSAALDALALAEEWESSLG
ncbi:hypothetical protein [Changpingibacter yushuensis]|uniref:hypothetical protein n=1 Tax=Changpingibacter yushuensis TaxID=2758440 RepID=UPI00165E6177|nr:hypothetical protein [Changpingibacter yushuensis]